MFGRKTATLLLCLIMGLLCLCPLRLFGQKVSKKSARLFEQALSAYRAGDWLNAENYALLSVRTDSLNLNAFLLIADISTELKNPVQQQWALEKVVANGLENNPLAGKLLSENYFHSGNYRSALKMIEAYKALNIERDSVYVAEMIKKCTTARDIVDNKHQMEIVHLGSQVNTFENEYWPYISADDSTLYFTRLITNEQRFHFERLFVADRDGDAWMPAQKLLLGGADEVNEGTISMSADGRILFFTACGRPDGMGSCDIYYMVKDNGKWYSPVNAGPVVNTNRWEAQPSVSAYGDLLFWTSNREGGVGGKDIWYAPITSKNGGKLEFGTPVNAGWGVNTRHDDYSPFIHADYRTLYFASEGHYGLGGADLYLSRFDGENWLPAKNLGYPINSRANDDGLVVSPTAHVAVFSSNREGTLAGSKDLFMMNLPESLQPSITGYVKGYVFDAVTHKKLDAVIELTNINDGKLRSVLADVHNGYIATLENNTLYAFNVTKPGYLFFSEHFDHINPDGFKDASVFNIYLQPISLAAKVVLNNIFFDHDSYLLKEESKIELQKVVGFLLMNPQVKVEIAGHTDSTGSEVYNLALSENRAKAIALHLQNSIDSNRIGYKGYGANKPVADNATEEGRGKNRRSELIITAY
jgi:outer membrane protein OmpA-like peptidoglycan-associated protein